MDSGRLVTVHLATIPGKKDLRKRNNFKLRDPCHQAAVNESWKGYGGYRFYIGFWHSHPEECPVASETDIAEWHRVYKINGHLPTGMFFPIVGQKSIEVWEIFSGDLERMKRVEQEC